jgi:hydroxylamine dehydrogenase
MKKVGILLCMGIIFFQNIIVSAADDAVSEATAECIDCHASIHPGIVRDWQKSRHAKITPQDAMAVDGLARKLSSKNVPENLKNSVVGCAECHSLNPKAHADTFEHNGYDIHVVVSPTDCRTCHALEAEQYSRNIMSHAYDNLAANPLYQKLELSITGSKTRNKDKIVYEPANAATKAETCYYCHGTKLKVIGTETRDTEAAGELDFPIIEGWPNQGVGRVNLDGSLGSCAACHTRHAFSIEMARKPYTCKECHVGPDVPAFKVYAASKHGNIYSAMNKAWDFKAVPWTIGKDFTAPTCATCHISLLVNTDEEVVSERTHQMNNRLPWRIFGLVYAHPHPLSPDTTVIRNKNGLPLPATLDGEFATEYLIDEKERETRKKAMQAACLNCHDTSWVKGHWQRFENTIEETNGDIRLASEVMGDIWREGLADFKANPFDEAIEKKWTDTWQLYANTIRFASAMGGGGDYGVYAGGRYQLSQALLEINDWLNLRKKMDISANK